MLVPKHHVSCMKLTILRYPLYSSLILALRVLWQCFYTGSLEGVDGAAKGKLLHQLADKRCANYKTCGENSGLADGMAKINYDILELINLGQKELQTGECGAARETVNKIISKMYVPMIQGAMRYAYKVGALKGGQKEAAEGAIFAAAVLPRVHAACEYNHFYRPAPA